jgi:hypothetical protein
MTGLEPALLSELEPKSSASASFATSPWVPSVVSELEVRKIEHQ